MSNEKLVQCSICKCIFHKSCYNQYVEILSNNENKKYNCIRCTQALQNTKNTQNYKCFICGNTNKTLNYNSFNDIFYHQICLFFINEIKELNIDKNIFNIKKWRFKNSCKYCGLKLSKTIAVIKCKKPNCKNFYHINSAIAKGLIFDIDFMKHFYKTVDKIPFYCSNHNKKIYNDYKNFVFNNLNYRKKDSNHSDIKTDFDKFDYKNIFNIDFGKELNKIELNEKDNLFDLCDENNIQIDFDKELNKTEPNEKDKLFDLCDENNIQIDFDKSDYLNKSFNINYEKEFKEIEHTEKENLFDLCVENKIQTPNKYEKDLDKSDYQNKSFNINNQKEINEIEFTPKEILFGMYPENDIQTENKYEYNYKKIFKFYLN